MYVILKYKGNFDNKNGVKRTPTNYFTFTGR